MIGILVTILGSLLRNTVAFAKKLIAYGRLLWLHAWMLYNWWLKYSQHSIVLRIAVWVALTAVIEATFAALASVTLAPLSSALLRTILPSGTRAEGLIWAVWDDGLSLRYAMQLAVAYAGLWLSLVAVERNALRTQYALKHKWTNPRVFAR